MTSIGKMGLISLASLAVDDELHKRLKIRCSELGLKIKNVANEAIEDWLKKHKSKGSAKFFFGSNLFYSKNRNYITKNRT